MILRLRCKPVAEVELEEQSHHSWSVVYSLYVCVCVSTSVCAVVWYHLQTTLLYDMTASYNLMTWCYSLRISIPACVSKARQVNLLSTKHSFLILETLARWYEQLNLLKKLLRKGREIEKYKNKCLTFRRGNKNCAEESNNYALKNKWLEFNLMRMSIQNRLYWQCLRYQNEW